MAKVNGSLIYGPVRMKSFKTTSKSMINPPCRPTSNQAQVSVLLRLNPTSPEMTRDACLVLARHWITSSLMLTQHRPAHRYWSNSDARVMAPPRGHVNIANVLSWYSNWIWHPGRHNTLIRCWVDVGTPSTISGQYLPNIVSASRVCWDPGLHGPLYEIWRCHIVTTNTG